MFPVSNWLVYPLPLVVWPPEIRISLGGTLNPSSSPSPPQNLRFAGLCRDRNGPDGYKRSMANAAAVLKSVFVRNAGGSTLCAAIDIVYSNATLANQSFGSFWAIFHAASVINMMARGPAGVVHRPIVPFSASTLGALTRVRMNMHGILFILEFMKKRRRKWKRVTG
jgi:hypothetical protein